MTSFTEVSGVESRSWHLVQNHYASHCLRVRPCTPSRKALGFGWYFVAAAHVPRNLHDVFAESWLREALTGSSSPTRR